MEHFTINGTLFLAFANYVSHPEGHETHSFIYKFNDLTGKFFLYQRIATNGGHDVEYFTISGEHYLAVANVFKGTTNRIGSVIYSWNGQLFVVFQEVATISGVGLNFFTIAKEPFLTTCNLWDGVTHSINSTIYKWKNNMFEKFQEIPTEGCRASAAFVISNVSYIAFANQATEWAQSTVVYKWSGKDFVKQQTLRSNSAYDVKPFYINNNAFLAIASQPDESYIYKWYGSKFGLLQSIPTHGARASYPFVMCGQTFLVVADRDKTTTVLYRFSAHGQFTKYQDLLSFGAIDTKSFEYKGHTYLAIANSRNNSQTNIESTVYAWI